MKEFINLNLFSERRIIFDYDTFGDSPPCLSDMTELEDEGVANIQGVGLDENGDFGRGLEAELRTMSMESCKDWAEYNATVSRNFRNLLKRHLRKGLTDDVVCAHGICHEFDTDGTCEGYTVSFADTICR